MGNFQKHPDVSEATKVGEPTLVDPEVVSATSVVQEATRAMMGGAAAAGTGSVAVETVSKGVLPPDQAAPRSDAPTPETAATPADNPAAPADDSNELKPNVPADPNELKPNVDSGAAPVPAPTQVNEIDPATSGQAAATGGKTADSASATADDKEVDDAMSSSKHKKKKGLRKVVPF